MHVPELRAAIPSITSATRYAVFGSDEAGGPKQYLCLYELAETDAADAAAAIAAGTAATTFSVSSAMDRSGTARVLPPMQILGPVR